MRWRKRYARIVKRFSLFPIKAKIRSNSDIYEWRWLETVYIYQVRDWLVGIFPFWNNVCFECKELYDAYISEIKKEKEK